MRAAAAWALAIGMAWASVAGAQITPLTDGDAPTDPPPLSTLFADSVAMRLFPPPDVVGLYEVRLQGALAESNARIDQAQFVVLVDRSPKVQALFLWWGGAGTVWRLVGAASVSTGQAGRFEHFLTPMGVFEHSLDNPDFRAEGTKNELGIRGYGRKGSRVYDFGWVEAPKTWGDRAMSVMRLQMHATDPDVLEQRLGTAQSKGCIRIHSSLNEFFDRNGILDAAYDEELSRGRRLWMLRTDRAPTPWSGRYLVVIDTLAGQRPAWAVPPAPLRQRAK